MDISKEYIEMCVAAKELQKREQLTIGWLGEQIWYNENDVWYQPNVEFNPYINIIRNRKKIVWLPRQDQLQEMLSKEYVDCHAMLQHFYEWCIENDGYLEDLFAGNESMEQLWLIFVMKEEFGKIWNGKSWYEFGKI